MPMGVNTTEYFGKKSAHCKIYHAFALNMKKNKISPECNSSYIAKSNKLLVITRAINFFTLMHHSNVIQFQSNLYQLGFSI